MSHYSLGQKPEKLAKWAKWTANMLYDILHGPEFKGEYQPLFVYRGMSGVAHATALGLEWVRKTKRRPDRMPAMFAYVRKSGEFSHGSRIELEMERRLVEKKIVAVFVDDFICSGETRVRTMRKFYEAKYFSNDMNKVHFISATMMSMGCDIPQVIIVDWDNHKDSFPD